MAAIVKLGVSFAKYFKGKDYWTYISNGENCSIDIKTNFT